MCGILKRVWGCLGKTILILLIVAGNAIAESQPPPQPPQASPQQAHSKNTDQKTANDQRGTEKSPLIIKVLPTKGMEEEAAQTQKDRKEKAEADRKLTEYTKDLSIFTEVLAFVAILQLIVFGLQAWKLHQTVKATKESADAALKSAELSEKGIRLAERANLRIDKWTVEQLAARQRPIVTCELINSGRSQAEIMEGSVGYSIGSEEAPPGGAPPEYNKCQFRGIAFAGGAIDITVPLLEPLTDDQFQRIVRGEHFIFLYGTISCKDIFDWTCEITYGAKIGRLGDGKWGVNFITSPGHNYVRWIKPSQENDEADQNATSRT